MKANAVFAGGGIKGIGLLGAFSVAEEQGYRWEKLAGTSVGGMLAALVASGYKAREIYEIIEGFDFTQLYDGDFQKLLPGLGMLTSIIFEKGIYQGRALENWMRSLLKAKRCFNLWRSSPWPAIFNCSRSNQKQNGDSPGRPASLRPYARKIQRCPGCADERKPALFLCACAAQER